MEREQPEGVPEPRTGPAREPAAVEDVGERRLDPRIIRLWRWSTAGAGIAAALGALALRVLVPYPAAAARALAGALFIAGAAAVAFWPRRRYRAWAFRLREADLLIRRGVLWRTISVVPYARIQHVDTSRGPLERWLGLAKLVVYTAGTRGASIAIPGLDAAEAERLRETLARSGGLEDAV